MQLGSQFVSMGLSQHVPNWVLEYSSDSSRSASSQTRCIGFLRESQGRGKYSRDQMFVTHHQNKKTWWL